jgi:hypothetical protein
MDWLYPNLAIDNGSVPMGPALAHVADYRIRGKATFASRGFYTRHWPPLTTRFQTWKLIIPSSGHGT